MKKKKKKMKTKTKTYRTIKKRRKEKKKKKKKLEHCWTQHMKKKRKERKNEHFFNRQYIDWKKEEKKTEHFWTVIGTLFWLVVKWKKNFFEFEFKGDIRNFFFLFILWNLTKTINRGFDTRFTNICNYIDSKKFF